MIPSNSPLLQSQSGSGFVADIVPFQFTSASPLTLLNLLTNDRIDKVEVVIDIPFNDPSAQLFVGTVADPQLVLGINDIDPNEATTYASDDNFFIPLAEILRLSINPGGSTQGSGVVLYTVRR